MGPGAGGCHTRSVMPAGGTLAWVACSALGVALIGVTPIVHAHTVGPVPYTLGSTPYANFQMAPLDVSLGGVRFKPIPPEVPVGVSFTSSDGLTPIVVKWMACQDFNLAVCGEAGEPRMEDCSSNGDLTLSAVPFDSARPTIVFVEISRPFQNVGKIDPCGSVMNIHLDGAVSLTYAP